MKVVAFSSGTIKPSYELYNQGQVLHFMEAINEVRVDQMSKVSQFLIFIESLKR